jgi:hypothetical protein
MLGVRSTVKNAPLYFYHGAYDYGAIFYAARRIPVYKGDLADFPVDVHTGSPSYLLVWAEDWPAVAATSDLRFEHLVSSDGKGPDKKHRLALIAVLPSIPSPPQENTENNDTHALEMKPPDEPGHDPHPTTETGASSRPPASPRS